MAPVRDQSGEFDRAGLRRAVYILARRVLRWDEDVKVYNRKLKDAGKTTARRQRSIADKQFRVLCAMARNRTFVDPNFASRSRRAA